MWKATKASLLAHRLRLVLTALAVSAGVGFVCGTLVLTDTLAKTFDTLFAEVSSNKSVIIRGLSATGDEDDGSVPVPDALLAKVRAVPGVKEARGDVFSFAQVVGPDGKAVASLGGAPTFGTSHQEGVMSSTRIASGKAPAGPNEVAIDTATAEGIRVQPGDRIDIVTIKGRRTYTLSGTLGFGERDNLAGATQVSWDLATAQQVLGREGLVDQVDVLAASGTSDEVLRERIAVALGAGFKVQTGDEAAGEQADQIKEGLSFINYFLGGFAVISLLVGSFIIVNTFTILVAQRTRELALFRALGAGRRQVLGSVLAEAAATGVVGSLLGVVGGILLAIALSALFGALGLDLPTGLPVVRLRTVAVGLGVGLVVTTAAAVLPAFRASRVPPVAAMSGAPVARSTPWWVAALVRIALVGVGVLGLYVLEGFLLLAFSALVAFVGLVLLLSLAAAPLASLVGAPLRALGVVGNLGQKNATRNPRRTASTAAALMVGLALVGGAATLQASANASIGKVIDGSISADFVLESGGFSGLTANVTEDLVGRPGVAQVASIGFTRARVGDGRRSFTALRTEGAELLTLRMLDGTAKAIEGEGGLLVSEKEADERGLKVGDSFDATFANGTETLRVGGIYDVNQLAGDYVISTALYRTTQPDATDFVILVKAAGDKAVTRQSIDEAVQQFPSVKVQTRAEFIAERKQATAVLLGVIVVLLVLSVLIAVLGVINTLALSVYERVRELGLLRAVGTRRGQIAGMVFVESILVAVIGGVLGLGFGVLIGVMGVRALDSEGLDELVVPYVVLAAGVVFSMGAGLVAALFPSFRATRLDILDSIAVD